MITVYVVYATPEQQIEIPLQVRADCTVALAIQRSGLLQIYQLRLGQIVVGVYGQRVNLDALVQAGDRIEIYRPLLIDPKQARQQRAQKRI